MDVGEDNAPGKNQAVRVNDARCLGLYTTIVERVLSFVRHTACEGV